MRQRTAAAAAVFFAALILSVSVPAFPSEKESPFSLTGYYKNFAMFLRPASFTEGGTLLREPDMGAVSSRLRAKISARISAVFSLDIEYDLSPRVQDARLFEEGSLFGGLQPADYRLTDFRDRLYPAPGASVQSFGLFHNLDRFCLAVKTGPADIFVGRQAVAWGSARIVNPTDILAPFAFNELDKEERRGVDAVRVRIPLGMMDELDLGVVAGEDFKAARNATFIRGKFYALKTDFSFLAVGFRRHLLLGLDVTRALGSAGFWLEAAWVFPEAFRGGEGREKGYGRASIGLDRNLGSSVYAFVEYHFNGAGSGKPEDSMPLFRTTAYRDGSVYLLGRHYFNLGAVIQVTPLVSLTSLLLFNLSDGSLMPAPSLEYNVAENIYLAAGGFIGLGKKPEHILGPLDIPPLLLHSEFGAYPDLVYTSFRIYF